MPAKWPIRTKLRAGLLLLTLIVVVLFGNAMFGLYQYRGLVKDLSARSSEFPLAGEVSAHISELRITLSKIHERNASRGMANSGLSEMVESIPEEVARPDMLLLYSDFQNQLGFVTASVERYRQQLDTNRLRSNGRIADDKEERSTLADIEIALQKIHDTHDAQGTSGWLFGDIRLDDLVENADKLQLLVSKLPSHMHNRLHALAYDVRAQYRTGIVLAWGTLFAALVVLFFTRRMFHVWISRPLNILVKGSRKVARGKFEHRIRLEGRNEMTELAAAMNAMTEQFCLTKDDLDEQVRSRTQEVVRSEQLASVGFLAAGVAHEINNPLASIALCSESLESRLKDVLLDTDETAADRDIVKNYVRMIQQEAFRCKQITERLLDFSRLGDLQKHPADLRDLTSGVIDVVQHLGKYNNKKVELAEGSPVIADINAQEIKQVVLNLITNALDSVDAGGMVWLTIRKNGTMAELVVKDNGCGMPEEIKKHIFEPFFTRRRGEQGTGLGLSISYRIVEEHDGRIEVKSEGPGKGSEFLIALPLAGVEQKESHHQYQAA